MLTGSTTVGSGYTVEGQKTGKHATLLLFRSNDASL